MVKPADKGKVRVKQDADYIFHELTRSICPECKTVIDAQIIIKETKVLMRKRCPTAGSSPSAPTTQWGTGRDPRPTGLGAGLDNARKKIAFAEKTNRLALQPADD